MSRFLILSSLASLILSISCGKVRDDSRKRNLEEIKNGIVGNWQSECIAPDDYNSSLDNGQGLSIIRSYNFDADGHFEKAQIVFSDARCGSQLSQLKLSGQYSVESTSFTDVFAFNRIAEWEHKSSGNTHEYGPENSSDQSHVKLVGNELVFGRIEKKGYSKAFAHGLRYRRVF